MTPSRRLAPALAASLAVHAVIAGAATLWLSGSAPARATRPPRLTVALLAPQAAAVRQTTLQPHAAATTPPAAATLVAAATPPVKPAHHASAATPAPQPAPTGADAQPVDTPPAPLSQVAPVYPQEALLQGLTGTVELEVNIDAGGRVQSARVVSSTGAPMFDQAALDAAYATRFEPARRNGLPIASTIHPVMVFDAPQPMQTALRR